MAEGTSDLLAHQLELEKRLAAHQADVASKIQELTVDCARQSETLLRELADARNEIGKARESLAVDLERAKVDIVGVAIDKTLKLFSEAKSVVQLVAFCTIPILFGAGFMAYSSLKSTATMFVDSKVKEWLSLSTPDSPVKTTLEQLRTRTVLDAFTVRLARQQSEGRAPADIIGLTEDELARLRQIMLDPSSTSADFSDAARLIKASRGLAASVSYDQEIAKVINAIFSEKNYADERKEYLFEVWWQERELIPVSIFILDGGASKYGERWMLLAFKNLARNSPEAAAKYAPTLLVSKQEANQLEAATYLSHNDPANKALSSWLDSLKAKNLNRYAVDLASVSSNSVDYLKDHTAAQLINATANRLYTAIQNGASLRLSQVGFDRELYWEHEVRNYTYTGQIDNIAPYFERDDLLTKVIRLAGNNVSKLTMVIAALEVPDKDRPLASIDVTLTGTSSIAVGAPTDELTKDRVVGPVRLSVQNDGVGDRLIATWQQPNGEYSSSLVLPGSKLQDAAYQYAFDRDKVGLLDMRRLTQHFQ